MKFFNRLSQTFALKIFLGGVLLLGSFTSLPFLATSSAQGQNNLQNLIDKAQRQGIVRVIVGLNIKFQAEGDLNRPQDKQRQRQSIKTLQNSVLQKMAGTNTRLTTNFKYIPYMAVEVDAAALAALAALPETTTFEEDVPVPPTLASSIGVIGADDAWAAGFTGSGQAVAILDTGVDKTHSFFTTGSDKVVSEACYSSNEAGVTSVCPGGVEESTAVGSGVNCPTSTAGCGHGTHVAGIAAGNNGGANIGVARESDIIAIQVFSQFTNPTCAGFGLSSPCALTFTSDNLKGLERVFELRNDFTIAAANMSLGGSQNFSNCDGDPRKAAIDNLRSVGIATAISSANSGYRDSMSAPGCISTAISVGATEDDDNVASFSNIASFINLLAPGVSINSSVPGGGTSNFNGTSMSSPHVAGAWAVIKQKAPEATVDEVLAALHDTGTSVDDDRIGGTVTDMRRINLDQALSQFTADLEIAKRASPDSVIAGQTLTYTLTITNNGPAIATNVLITDTVPVSATLNPASLSGEATTTGTTAGSIITWNTGETLNPNQSLSRTLVVTVATASSPPSEIVNTAYVSATTASSIVSDTVTTRVIVPEIVVNPPSLNKVQEVGIQATQLFTINNTGSDDLTWHIDEAAASSALSISKAAEGDTFNLSIEDISISIAATCDVVADIPWLDVSPSSGATLSGTQSLVNVTFDSAGLAVDKIFTSTLCLHNNDPKKPLLQIPVSLMVTERKIYLPAILKN